MALSTTCFRGDPSCVNCKDLVVCDGFLDVKGQTWPGWVVTLCPSSATTLPTSARVFDANGASLYPYSSWLAKGNISLLNRMNLMPYRSFQRSIFMMSRAFASPKLSTHFCPRTTSAGFSLSGRFLVGCSGWLWSFRGWRCSRMEAIRHVRELNTEGVEYRRYVLRHA